MIPSHIRTSATTPISTLIFLTPTENGVSFESAQKAAYIPATLQDKILIFKAAAKQFSFYQKQDWKNHKETHVQNPTIKFQK